MVRPGDCCSRRAGAILRLKGPGPHHLAGQLLTDLADSQHDVQHDTSEGQGSLPACHLESACLLTAWCPEGSGWLTTWVTAGVVHGPLLRHATNRAARHILMTRAGSQHGVQERPFTQLCSAGHIQQACRQTHRRMYRMTPALQMSTCTL